MRIERIEKVKEEMLRLADAIRQLEQANGNRKPGPLNVFLYHPRETGAVRRASMDVTRALADLRRAD